MTDTTATTITEYARAHGLDPADLLAIIATDPGDESCGFDPWGRWIELSGGAYADALYPTEYLDMIAASVRDEDAS